MDGKVAWKALVIATLLIYDTSKTLRGLTNNASYTFTSVGDTAHAFCR